MFSDTTKLVTWNKVTPRRHEALLLQSTLVCMTLLCLLKIRTTHPSSRRLRCYGSLPIRGTTVTLLGTLRPLIPFAHRAVGGTLLNIARLLTVQHSTLRTSILGLLSHLPLAYPHTTSALRRTAFVLPPRCHNTVDWTLLCVTSALLVVVAAGLSTVLRWLDCQSLPGLLSCATRLGAQSPLGPWSLLAVHRTWLELTFRALMKLQATLTRDRGC